MKQKCDKAAPNEYQIEQEFSLSIIPVSSQKIPFKPWTAYQAKVSPISEWYSHYQNQGTIGVITGKVSGNLEIIDVDVKNDPYGTIMDEYKVLIPTDLYQKLVIQTTPNKGFHLIYRCPDTIIEKSQKLALHSNQAVIIETRGQGGYFCTNKINNEVIQGEFDLEKFDVDIPVVSPAEREFLMETARSLTRYFPTITTINQETFVYSEPAINEFNNKYPIIDLFIKHRWSVVNEDDEKYYLLRDGSSAAHSGYYFKSSKVFFCFSTSTAFKPEKPYNHFQVLQILEGNNDYRTTLRLLPEYGFELQKPAEKKKKITPDDIAAYLNKQGVMYDTFIQDLTINGKIIDEKDYNTLYIDLKKYFDKEIPRTNFEDVIKSHYIDTINPIQDFIDKNKHRRPSGTFEQWLDCMSLKNPSIDRSVVIYFLKKWYVGMIAQAMDGEYPNEFFLTLLSIEQGLGKTTLLRNYTLPKELQDYRVEHSLSFDDDFKVIMGQALLIIDDEMDGRTYEQDKTFKTILSTKNLTTRRKYDRRISTIKRRCSFAGSGNHLNVVRESRNRRIIPIELDYIDHQKLDQVDLIDLFMEAYHLYIGGFKYSYGRDDNPLLNHIYRDYLQETDVDLLLNEYVDLPESSSDVYFISAIDLISTLADHHPHFSKRLNVVTIGKLMNDKGYKTLRKGKNKITGYEVSEKSKIVTILKSNENFEGGLITDE
jgi:predicted P-loop ATPase